MAFHISEKASHLTENADCQPPLQALFTRADGGIVGNHIRPWHVLKEFQGQLPLEGFFATADGGVVGNHVRPQGLAVHGLPQLHGYVPLRALAKSSHGRSHGQHIWSHLGRHLVEEIWDQLPLSVTSLGGTQHSIVSYHSWRDLIGLHGLEKAIGQLPVTTRSDGYAVTWPVTPNITERKSPELSTVIIRFKLRTCGKPWESP